MSLSGNHGNRSSGLPGVFGVLGEFGEKQPLCQAFTLIAVFRCVRLAGVKRLLLGARTSTSAVFAAADVDVGAPSMNGSHHFERGYRKEDFSRAFFNCQELKLMDRQFNQDEALAELERKRAVQIALAKANSQVLLFNLAKAGYFKI